MQGMKNDEAGCYKQTIEQSMTRCSQAARREVELNDVYDVVMNTSRVHYNMLCGQC